MKIGEQSAFPDVRGAYGMTYRQWLFGIALQGLASKNYHSWEQLAEDARLAADAGLAELEKEQNARPTDSR